MRFLNPGIFLLLALHQYHFSGANSDDEEETETQGSTVNPGKHRVRKKCSIQLNEAFLGSNTAAPMQFIEIRKLCPPNLLPPSSLNLDGHVIVAIELSNAGRLLMVVHLRRESVREVSEEDESSESSTTSYLHVTGTRNVPEKSLTFSSHSLARETKIQYLTHPDEHNILPQHENTANPVAILLLYYNSTDRRGGINLRMSYYTDANVIKYFDLSLREDQITTITGHVKDYIIYGNNVNGDAESLMRRLLQDEEFQLSANLIRPNTESGTSEYSISRCDNRNMDSSAFDLSTPTPFKANDCSKRRYTPPYNFQGHAITTDGQRMAINVLYYIRKHKDELRLRSASFATVAPMLGINRQTLEEFDRRHQTSAIYTPGRKRKSRNWKREQIDSFDRDRIRTIIASFYKNNNAPFFKDIYTKFLEYKRNGCVSDLGSGDEDDDQQNVIPSEWVPLCNDAESNEDGDNPSHSTCGDRPNVLTCTPRRNPVNTNDQYYISPGTFSKVLKEMGFYYGRIDKRVALLLRQDIVAWRARFLTALKNNDNQTPSLKVTYLDETWIDPNLKAKKGWTLKKPKSYRQKEKYSYRRLKQGHGPRIIALAAGDDDGIIKESVLVYKVMKNPNSFDYHENVNKEGFFKWFKDLLAHFKSKGEQHIIVIDNAPYHSSLKTPKQSEKKAVLYEWLSNIKANTRLDIEFELHPRMRKWELWELIQTLKKRPELQKEIYELDSLAAAEGHQILRLAPYQCDLNPIEYTWNDVKQQVARENLRQNVDEMVTITQNVLENYSVEKWKKQLAHVKKLSNKYYHEDGLMDIEVEPLIIPLSDDDDEDEDSEIVNSCGRETSGLADEACDQDFDPIELERQWDEDRTAVNEFHQNTPHFPGPPPMQPVRLFRCRRP